MTPVPDDNDWQCGWEDARKRQLTAGFEATPAQRLAWLEEMMVFAHHAQVLSRLEGAPILLRDSPDFNQRKEGGT